MSAYIYTVEGEGRFPIDLLPDEQAWPRNTWDACAMAKIGRRSCQMLSARRPNEQAWRTAGWEVKRVDMSRL